MGKKQVISWQRELNIKGFMAGAEDGDFGPRSLGASMDALMEAGMKDNQDGVASITTNPTPGALILPKVMPAITNHFRIPDTTRYIDEIIIHCAATREGVPIGRDPVAVIDRWHRRRKFNGIGYHAVFDLDGEIWMGRAWSREGAHVRGHNTGTLGFSYVGGVENTTEMKPKDTRTPEQRASMLWLVKQVTQKYNIRRISGHNQYAAKACPSFDVRTDELGNITNFTKGVRHG